MRPYILRFAKRRIPAHSPVQTGHYSIEAQLTLESSSPGAEPVVNLPHYAGVKTKKQDIEKGEDLKDRKRSLDQRSWI